MRKITQLTIFLGCMISLFPLVILKNNLGILLTIFFFGLIIILSDLGLESRQSLKGLGEK